MPVPETRRLLVPGRDVGLVALVFLIGWALSFKPAVLLGQMPPPFVGWSDQDRYLQSAHAFMRFDLHPDQHWYPVLYALLLAPVIALPPLYAALLVDLACFMVTYLAFRRFARGWGVNAWGAAALFIPATVAWPQTGDGWLQPWTTTPSAALIWVALTLAADVLHAPPTARMTSRAAIACGMALGLIPVSRPGDLVISAVVGLFLVVALLHRGDRAGLGRLIVAALVPLVIGIALHLAIHGPAPSDYMRLSAAYGENLGWIGWKSWLLLIEPRPWYPEGFGLFTLLPWLPFGLCGLLLALLRPGPGRAVAAMTAGAVTGYGVLTLGYLDLLPSGLWRFGNVHYFKWMFPVLALFAWLLARDGRRNPRLALGLVGMMLALTSVRFEPVPVAPDAPARLVVFARPPAPFKSIYDAHSMAQDRAGLLRNGFDIHLVPGPDDGDPVHAEALRRDFTGGERWIHPGNIALWPKMRTTVYTTPALPGRFPISAVARYRPAIAWGLPCWLPPYPCPVAITPAAR